MMGPLEYRLDGNCYYLSGALNFANAGQLSALITVLVSQNANIVVSLAGIKHADSAATAFMVELYRQLSLAGNELSFIDVPAHILSVLSVTRLDTILPIAA